MPIVTPPFRAGFTLLNVDYIAPIPRDGISGRSKASSEKAAALERVAPGSRTYLLGAAYQGRTLRQLAGILVLEVRYLAGAPLRRPRPKAIITRSPLPLGALLAGWLLRVPVIKEIHTDIRDEAPLAFARRKMKQLGFRALHYADIWSSRRADAIIFNNTALERHFRENYLRQDAITTTIPNGTDITMFRVLDRQACRKDLGLEPDRRYLVWVGAINPWHGVEYVVRLTDTLPQEYQVIIAGKANSGYANRLISRCDDKRIIFTGALEPSVAAKYMNAADACLLPVNQVRVSPGSPLKLYDYAACGVPIVTQRDTQGYSDVVLDSGIGIAVDFGDPAKASRDIQAYLLRSEKSRDKIRQLAVERFSWERRMDAWLEFAAAVRRPREYRG